MTLQRFFLATTNLGDSSLTSALTILMTAYLLFSGQRRAALAMALAFTATAAVIAAGKILFYDQCIPADNVIGLQSPSGHSAIALAVYGTISCFIASLLQGWRRWLPFAATAFIMATIALSRIELGAHTPADVVAGLVTGLTITTLIWLMLLRDHQLRIDWKILAILTLTLMITSIYGAVHLPAEGIIRRLAALLQTRFHLCRPA